MLRMKIGASHDFTHDLSSSVKSARLHVSLAINTSTPRDKRIIGELPYLLLWPALRSCTFAAPSTRNPQIQICENDKGDFPAIINYTGRVLLPLLWKPSDILLINWYSYYLQPANFQKSLIWVVAVWSPDRGIGPLQAIETPSPDLPNIEINGSTW